MATQLEEVFGPELAAKLERLDKNAKGKTHKKTSKKADSRSNRNRKIKEKIKAKAVSAIIGPLPRIFDELLSDGTIRQWEQFPDYFFVSGVEFARIIYRGKGKLHYKYNKRNYNTKEYKHFKTVLTKIESALGERAKVFKTVVRPSR